MDPWKCRRTLAHVPGSIQSIERAASVLKLLGAVGEPVSLGDLARMLALPKPTMHGIVRTLCDVGFVAQDHGSGRYRLGPDLAGIGDPVDPHLLRSRSVNWADGLAARSGLEVQVGIPNGRAVELIHHVFRPDGSPQRLRVGELQPLHATALGHVLLAFSPVLSRRVSMDRPLPDGADASAVTRGVRHTHRRGWALVDGGLTPGTAAIAAPIRHHGGVVVGALAAVGPSALVVGPGGEPRGRLRQLVTSAARSVSDRLEKRL